ncbi:hypothetical protein Tco_1158125 [Tanacetum coccineum]
MLSQDLQRLKVLLYDLQQIQVLIMNFQHIQILLWDLLVLDQQSALIARAELIRGSRKEDLKAKSCITDKDGSKKMIILSNSHFASYGLYIIKKWAQVPPNHGTTLGKRSKDKDVGGKTKDVGDKTRNGKPSRGSRLSVGFNAS